jgi:hypothetical protein
MSTVIDGSAGVTTNVGAVYNGIQSSTIQNSTSGTAITFSSIPSWVKRITVMLNGVSTNGSSNILIQVGAGSVATSGYNSTSLYSSGASVNTVSSTAGFNLNSISATQTLSGIVVISTLGSNIWVANGQVKKNTTEVSFTAGDITLGGTLDRVVVTSVTPDTFDAGSINILYE